MNVIEVALNSGMKHLLIEIRQMVNIKLGHERKKDLSCLVTMVQKNFVFHRLEPPLDKNHRTCQHVMMVSMKQSERNSFWSCLTAHKNRYRPLPMNFGTHKNDWALCYNWQYFKNQRKEIKENSPYCLP